MKRKIFLTTVFLLAAVVLMVAVVSFAEDFAGTSGEQTSSTVICNRPCRLTAVTVITDGTNDATLKLYDHASAASGTVILEMTVVGANNYGGRNYVTPLMTVNGCYAEVSGSNASYIVEFR